MDARKVDRTVRHWMEKTRFAREAFEAQWAVLSLKAEDPPLYLRLREQEGLFDAACVTGTMDEVEDQGAALVRGWDVCAATLASLAAVAPKGVLLGGAVGSLSSTGVIISRRRPESDDWVRENYGTNTIWLTPDEVAYLINLPELKMVRAAKLHFPTSDIQPEEPG